MTSTGGERIKILITILFHVKKKVSIIKKKKKKKKKRPRL
jgi:hypothetical protein